MSTKNDKYSFIEQSFTTSENRYYNLNLSQREKCANLVPVQSHSKSNNDEYCAATDFIVSDNFEENEKLQSWNKSPQISIFTTLNEWKNGNTLNTSNKSTLSLHISAYENSIAPDLFGNENIEGLKKEKFESIKTSKQSFIGAFKSQNPFEYPRQQNGDQKNKPEIAQFKASQKLLDSKQPSSSQQLAPESSSTSENDSSEESENLGLLTPAEMSFVNDTIEKLMRAPLKFHRGGAKGELVQKATRTKPLAPDVNIVLTKSDILHICELAADSFLKQKSLVEIQKEVLPLSIFGDIHGQFRDLRMMLHATGHPDNQAYVFLGDYVDRGPQGIEGLCLLLCLKVKYPHRVFLLRGNHEDYNTTMVYGFYDECGQKYNHDNENIIFQNFVHVFNCMPFAALIGGRILCMHGGISPDLDTLNKINLIKRPTMIPLHGLATDIVWSDPGGKNPGWSQSNRGISFTYDDATIEKFCRNNNVDLIVRGHQITNEMQNSGYQFTSNNRMLTIFSAFNYLNTNNTGASLQILPGMKCRFRLFRPVHPKKVKQPLQEVIPPLTATLK